MSTKSTSRIVRACATTALTLLFVWGSFGVSASAKEYTIGMMCDRSGPTKNVGPYMCPGFHDYVKLFNAKNMLPGGTIKVMEIDHGYNVPRGIEAYERFKAAGVVSIALYGTPHTVSVTPKLSEDKILGTSPGFGSAAGANGQRFPYLFPAAASYWSQIAAGVKFIEDNWKGSKQPKIAYLYYDNPAGREPLPILADLQKKLGFEIHYYAVPAPAIEMRPQVLDITRKFKADWVILHFFGQAGIALKEHTRMAFPRNRMIGLVWAGGESDMVVAGWDNAEGYHTIQFAWVGSSSKNLNQPILQGIADLYKAEGKPVPPEMDVSVYYNRGVMGGAIHSEAIRAAVAAKGADITGEDVKNAMEHIQNFNLPGGFMAPVNMSPQDHEGGGFVRIFQVRDNGFQAESEWFQGYRDVVMEHVMAGS